MRSILISNNRDLKELETIKSQLNKKQVIPINNIDIIRFLYKFYKENKGVN